MDFSDILKLRGYNPKEVRLVRHAGSSWKIYLLWRNDREKYDLYCRIQKSKNLGKQKYVANFIATPEGRTLFTGFDALGEQKQTWYGLIDPVTGKDVHKMVVNGDPVIIYDVTRVPDFDSYAGKLSIGWGNSSRAWSQVAGQTPKPVLEIRQEIFEPEFPGFSRFICSSRKVSVLPERWKSVLSASRGIYILVHTDTQAQYIGSATGEDGFLGRWLSYEVTGHGGNNLLRKLKNQEFQIGILEVSSSAETRDDILGREQEWKAKMGSRAFGLNAN